MDTQVSWGDSKFFPQDNRNLLASFTADELKNLYEDPELSPFLKNAQISFEQWQNSKRNQLIPAKDLIGLKFLDLGEVRATHWSVAFHQVSPALPPLTKEPYFNPFPQKQLVTSLLEIIALHKFSVEVEKEKGGEDTNE